MRRIRFRIASLLIAVVFVAVGFAALRESSELWDSGLFHSDARCPPRLDPPCRSPQ